MTTTTTAPQPGGSLIVRMAERYGLEPGKFYSTLEKTILPAGGKQATQEQVAAFLVVAHHYELNPFVKEIYAFPNQSGGITPIVSVDGWLTLINRQANLDGIEYQDHFDDVGNLTAITCRIYRKDRSRPNEITEYMNECRRNTSTWGTWPARMLRHKALIQCARQAFGLAGIYDPDEAERIASGDSNGNGSPMAEKTRAKVDDLKSKIAPEPVAEEPDAIDAEIIEETAAEPINDAPPPDTDEAALDPVESLRADVLAVFNELPKDNQKELLVGKPGINKMSDIELTELLAEIRKQPDQ